MGELCDAETLEQKRIREERGGRKSALETIAGLKARFFKLIENYTIGLCHFIISFKTYTF